MDLSFLTNYINPVILGICLLVGYVIKTAIPAIKNRYIPLAALTMGTIIAILINMSNFFKIVIKSYIFGIIIFLSYFEANNSI